MDNIYYILNHSKRYSTVKINNYVKNDLISDIDVISNIKNIDLDKAVLLCLTDQEKRNIISKYEMNHYKVDTKEFITLDEFKNKFYKIVKQFQWKAGGYELEDESWYYVKNSDWQLTFTTTVHGCDKESQQLDFYLYNLIKILSSLAKNILVDITFDDEKYRNIIEIILTISDNSHTDYIDFTDMELMFSQSTDSSDSDSEEDDESKSKSGD